MSFLVGKIVVTKLGTSPNRHFIGLAYGAYSEPTYLIEIESGENTVWAASLTREATPDEAAEYWKQRALKAEAK